MKKLKKESKLRTFLRCEQGSVAIEYSLIASAMFLAISPAFYLVRDSVNVKFQAILNYLTAI